MPTPGRWQRRAGLSRALRAAVVAGPVAVSFGVATLLAHVLPRAQGAGALLFTVLIAGVSLGTLVVLERAARRLLPLAALLNLSLHFPDRAPARFAVARRTGSPQDLRARLARAQAAGHDSEARSMQSVVELVLALSVHDRASRGHSERVRVFTDLIADELKLPESDQARLRWAALLHDIGKLEVPAALLNKAGRPTEAEWARLHRHPEDGARLVASLLPWLGEWGLAVEQHHERFDGTGYPHRLRGQEISLAARIVSVADSYEVMTAPRAYKRPMSVATARRELVRVAGTQLDPAIVRAFLNVSVGRLWRTIGVGAWIAQLPTLGRVFSFGGMAGSGVATAAAATVLTIGGIASAAAPTPAALGGMSLPAIAAAPAPTATATHSAPPTAPPKPRPTQRPTTTSTAAFPSPSARPATTAAPTETPQPVATPKPAPTATPAPTLKPTPTPAADPYACTGCTGTAANCSNHCSGSNLASCTTYCQGNNNAKCNTHCVGNNNPVCTSYCWGTNNARCKTNCRNTTAPTSAAATTPPSTAAPRPSPSPTAVRPPLPGSVALMGFRLQSSPLVLRASRLAS